MEFNIKKELYESVKGIKWNFKGIIDTDGRIHEIPTNLNFQALFEVLTREKLAILKSKHGITIKTNENIRSYLDIVLKDGILGDSIIALDVKTGRRVDGKTRFTLGSLCRLFYRAKTKIVFWQ